MTDRPTRSDRLALIRTNRPTDPPQAQSLTQRTDSTSHRLQRVLDEEDDRHVTFSVKELASVLSVKRNEISIFDALALEDRGQD